MSVGQAGIHRRRAGRWLAALAPVVLSAAFVAVLIGARQQGWLQPAELFAYDVMLRLRSAPAGAPEVAIIAVGDAALDEWGWPIPDGKLADLIDAADEAGAAAIALDIYRDRPVPPGHEQLVAALRRAPAFGAMKFSNDGGAAVDPPPVLKSENRFGVIDVPVDEDGVMRRMLLYVDDGQTVFPSLALKVALDVLQSRGIRPAGEPDDPASMRLGAGTVTPIAANAGPYQAMDAGGYQVLPDFRRSDADLATLDARAVLDGNADIGALGGKIVFIGITSELVKDLVVTPRAGSTASGLLHGVVLHAWMADQLIRLADGESRLLDVLEPRLETATVAAAGVVGLAVGLAIASPLALIIAGLGLAAVAVGGSVLLFDADVWVPVVPGTVAALGSLAIAVGGRASAERRQRRALMQLFSQQVSAQVADDLWRRRDTILDNGLPRPLRLDATVMFMDLAGSTNIADRLEPETYMRWVGRFLERMAETAIENGGLVDKYTGDGLMVVFGAPVPRTQPDGIDGDARAAVACALAMGRTLKAFNAEQNLAGHPKARVRIGIHSGGVFAGCVGARERAQYTVMGATVNAAARLEGLKELIKEEMDRDVECRILISETTAEMVRKDFVLLEAGSVVLRGFSEPIAVFLVEGEATGSDPEVR